MTDAGKMAKSAEKALLVGNVAKIVRIGTARPLPPVGTSLNGQMEPFVPLVPPARPAEMKRPIGGAKPLLPVETNPNGKMELVAWLELAAMPARMDMNGGIPSLGIIVVRSPAGEAVLSVALERRATIAAGVPSALGISLVSAIANKFNIEYDIKTRKS